MKRPALFAFIVAALVALVPIARTPAQANGSGIEAGAAKRNVLPFTVIPGVTVLDPHANAAASNPDGLPGGLWDTFEPEIGFSSSGQIAPNGVWGEPFTDANGNGIFDVGESFTDDLVNTRLDVLSVNKWDGIYMAGYGSPRQPRGAFDPLWARALYLRDAASGLAVAQVSLDFLGWFSDWNDRVVALARAMDPSLDLDQLVVSHTHNHEGPDTHVGLWGPDVLTDGTYPKYERYVEVKMAEAIVEAAANTSQAEFRFGSMTRGQQFTTMNGETESLDGLQSRNSCRTPWVFDDELRVMHIRATGSGEAIGTLVNWGTHVESLDSRNVYLSSDFVHSIRQTVEDALGGVAVYVPGAQGAVEVIGDSCTRRWQRDTFDGETHPLDDGGSPIATENADTAPIPARNRTYAIGRVVGSAAVRAIEAATVDTTATAIEGFRSATLDVPINNMGLSALSAAGVIDKPGYIGGLSVSRAAFGAAGMSTSPLSGVDGRTSLYAWRIGSASFVTAPGELAPELYWGLTGHNKAVAGSPHSDYEAASPDALACAARAWSYGDTPGGNTGRPFEPGIREGQVKAFQTTHNFLLGYTPDLLGYIVPGYDFAWYAAPPAHGVGLGAVIGEAPDPCRDMPPDDAYPQARYSDHYHETNSASSMLAPAVTCGIWNLLGEDPSTSTEGNGACTEWNDWRNAILLHVGIDPSVCDPQSETDCVRHY